MSFADKIQAVIAVVLGMFFSLFISFSCVWVIARYWLYFPEAVQVFVGLVGTIFVYLTGLGLVTITMKAISVMTDRRVYMASEDGFYIEEKGRLKGYPTLRGASPMKQLGTKLTEEITDVPRLATLLQDDMLVSDYGEVLLGYRPNNTPLYGKWPSVFAMLGIGNSGKSVSMVLFIVIAVLLGYEVVVCDPHKTKARSIYKKLAALEGYITFAFTSDEILREAQNFSKELKLKKDGIGLDQKKLLVFDELTSIVKRNKDISKQIVTVVEEASQEGMGYDHNVMLACHGVTEDSIGDVSIRNALNGVFCHRIDTDQSKYVIKDKRFNRKTGNLPSGHVFFRNELHEIEYIVMPFSDDTDITEALKHFKRKSIVPMGRVVTGTLEYHSPMQEIEATSSVPKQEVNINAYRLQAINKPLQPLQPNPLQVSIQSDLTEDEMPEEGVNSEDVNKKDTEKAIIIHRMRKRKIAHRDIAYTLQMYGEKYAEYRDLCQRFSIPIE